MHSANSRNRGFQLSKILKLFDIKSIVNNEKHQYHFVLEHFLIAKDLQWDDLSVELVSG